jgi:adenine phosphoribosyltransferase|tara:strand:- start:4998 stop:5507 length:510 start_codon:yes stop_codon:yes gene_type:complete
MDLKEYIRTIPDFPQKGILYRDITPLLSDHKVFSYVVNQLSDKIPKDVTSIIAPESRGFIFASAVCYKTNKNLVLVRKKGKLPYKTFDIEYELEYGTDTFQIHTDSIEHGSKIAIIDDLLATGGTAVAIQDLVKNFDCEISCISFVIELLSLNGRNKINCKEINSLIQY